MKKVLAFLVVCSCCFSANKQSCNIALQQILSYEKYPINQQNMIIINEPFRDEYGNLSRVVILTNLFLNNSNMSIEELENHMANNASPQFCRSLNMGGFFDYINKHISFYKTEDGKNLFELSVSKEGCAKYR